jgi:hypothetical protein
MKAILTLLLLPLALALPAVGHCQDTAARAIPGTDTALKKSHELGEVIIRSRNNRQRVESTQVGLETVDRKTALQLPAVLGEVDIIKVFQLKPGVKNSGEATSGISVRGGSTDQNLFLFDGTPVYNPSHLFGFFSTFNIDAVQDVNLYKAGFPAEYSGRLSSIVAINSARGTDSGLFGIGGGIGLIASRLNVQGNLLRNNKKGRKLTYNIAGRRTYADIFTRMINASGIQGPDSPPIPDYYFYDANARIDYVLNEKDRIFASIYYGRDFFKLNGSTLGTTFSWGNTAASLHWLHRFSGRLQSELSLHLADYNYKLRSGIDQFSFNLGSGVQEYGMTQKFTWKTHPNHVLNFGWSASRNAFAVARFEVSSSRPEENLTSGESLQATEGGLFAADQWRITPGLTANMGARFTLFRNGTVYQGLEPRLSLRQMITPNLSVKASYSRMQQYKHLVSSSGASLPTDLWYPSTAVIKPEISDQAALGMAWNLGEQWMITGEGYHKWMRQLVDYKQGANLFTNGALESEFVFGAGRSYGGELMIEKTAGKLRGWVGYTLAWTTRSFPDINNGKPFFPRYDRRHELSIVGMYPITKRASLSASWTFYTGNAVTLPTGRVFMQGAPGTTSSNDLFVATPLYTDRGNYRMPDYHRLDLSLVYKLRPKNGSSDITISAYNAYSRLNPYFISFEPARTNSTAKSAVPAPLQAKAVTLFPILPSISYNFRF